jgi:isoleucyl-tRNA synthetase
MILSNLKAGSNFDDTESVHLCTWGNVEELEAKDVEAIEKMELVREMVTNILEERNKASIKVRQPLPSATFKTAKFDSIKTSGEYLGEVMDETNVRSLNFVESDGSTQVCELDTNITDELKVEGVYRELVRTIQDARKLAGLKVGENVNIQLLNSLSDFEKQVVESKKAELQKECNLNEIAWGEKLEILR